jgi:hypothetical protein
VTGGSQCVVFLSSDLSNGAMVSRKLDREICVGWGIYNTICKLELEFLWKSNVVWDLCGFENFEKRGQWVQESEIKAIWPFGNLKPFYDEEGGFFVGFWTKFKWPLAQARVKFRECICRSIYMCFSFCLFMPSFLSQHMCMMLIVDKKWKKPLYNFCGLGMSPFVKILNYLLWLSGCTHVMTSIVDK